MSFKGSLQDLRILVAAYEEQSFTAAASRLASTQSGVSHHIRTLETQLNVRLFVRGQGKMVPTRAADILYERCLPLLRGIDEAAGQVRYLAEGEQGNIVAGMIPALCKLVIPAALTGFGRTNPNVKVRIVEAITTPLIELVKSGEVDWAIGASDPLSAQPSGVLIKPLAMSHACLITSAEMAGGELIHRTPPRKPIRLLWSSGQEEFRLGLLADLKAAGVGVADEMFVDSPLTVLSLIERQGWATVASCMVIDPEHDAGRFAVLPLLHGRIRFPISVIESLVRSPDPVGRGFRTLIGELVEQGDANWSRRFAES